MPSTPKKPPKQLRLVFKRQIEHMRDDDGNYTRDLDGRVIEIELPRLGYATAYTPNTKAYEKAVKSQNDWAYADRGWTQQWFERDGKIWTREPEVRDGYFVNRSELNVEKMIADNLQPTIIDNIPLEGFKIARMVTRSSSYSNNKLWRILDPRGFELEITSGTFEDIVMSGVIDKGVIVGECIWQTGKQLVRI